MCGTPSHKILTEFTYARSIPRSPALLQGVEKLHFTRVLMTLPLGGILRGVGERNGRSILSFKVSDRHYK